MIRRGALRAMLGGIAAAPFARAAAPAPLPRANMAGVLEYGGSTEITEGRMVTPNPDYDRRWNAWKTARDGVNRRQRRQDLARAFCGGWPPHLLTMQSNATWFRAQRAAKWIEAREFEDRSFMEKLRLRFFPEGG